MNNDKELKTFNALFATVWVVTAVASLAVLGFGVWVVVALLTHFGIV